ncbi:replication initiation protein RepC [Agrobacterium salinitolerans]|uniref:plasmid replication protein RepC n=1 Tax=Agrobacterium salinitolerans TaxID=1183413 RepID=UPI00099006E3|nr:plasmid replication protein RepC [Agrobacterium salinitolerans]OOO27827.1 replication initiation protein RepC [Agrobacterium salinitolerans]PNQ25729.1 replication initiation protein RepC [Rhizobium sp. YIC5082]
MENGSVTTPFGRRSMTFGMLASQMASRDIEAEKAVDKWKIYRALCEARPKLGVTDRALAVLNALLSFYPKNELCEETGLIVFPSNAQLSLRAHGMAEQTIRRHLAALIEAGLLIRKDSPNGKRYAHKGRGGVISEAFGFSLAPLLARADEIEALAAEVIAERLRVQRLRERLTLCRRDITKLVEAANENDPSEGWLAILGHMQGILERLPRTAPPALLEDVLDELEMLREETLNRLEMQLKSQKLGGNPNQSERHIQNSKPDSILESEPAFETKQGARAEQDPQPTAVAGSPDPDRVGARQTVQQTVPLVTAATSVKSFPLGLVLQACPQIPDYATGGRVQTWRDLMQAAVVVRSMLGVSPSAYEEAAVVLGPENAATVIACILERGGQINSAGGYLRDLTRRAERGEFAIGPMLMAQLRANGPQRKSA